MEIKLFELRDEGTHIPIFAFSTNSHATRESLIFQRAGFLKGSGLIIMGALTGTEQSYDPDQWEGGRSMRIIHQYLCKHWDDLRSGDLLDVRYIMGEVDKPCETELGR